MNGQFSWRALLSALDWPLLAAVAAASVLGACSININLNSSRLTITAIYRNLSGYDFFLFYSS